jgi:hypothetical protein
MTLREITFETELEPAMVYSRLPWAVERVDELYGQLANGVTVETNKSWVGVLVDERMQFDLIEPSGIFSVKFLQIIISGHITSADNKASVHVKFKLGWFPLYISAIIYLGALAMLVMTALYGELSDLASLAIWVLVFPILWTIVLNRKLKRIEKKVENLLGLSSS